MHISDIELPLLRDVVKNPSGFDSLSNYMGEVPEADWLCLLTRNRDSDCLTESNWRTALNELGGEGEDVEIHRFGHWACGWWEALAVRDGSPQADIAREIHASLSDYPVLNEEDFSELEDEEAQRIWRDCYRDKDRLEYIRQNRQQFEFSSFADVRACIRGDYFCGYASELIA